MEALRFENVYKNYGKNEGNNFKKTFELFEVEYMHFLIMLNI